MNTSNFSQCRFIAYAIPTGPEASDGAVGEGIYLGNADADIDFSARIAILKNAVDCAKSQLPPDENLSEVINVFMAPEFFFHGTQGPYIYASIELDPVPKILAQLSATFNKQEYPNWTFIFGTMVTAHVANIDNVFQSASVICRNNIVSNLAQQLQDASGASYQLVFNTLRDFINNCQDAPNVTVRDRAIVVSNILLDTPTLPLNTNLMTTEKYFLSGEDFLLRDQNGRTDIITEQMVGYARIDLSNGDLKHTAFDSHTIFRQNYGVGNLPAYMDFAVEICLDHDDARLRNNLGLQPFPQAVDGIHIQLIPSYGSQIVQENVVADSNGFVFNCDGQSTLDGSSGIQEGNLYGVECLYANYSVGSYAAHSQLARVALPAQGNNLNLNPATFQVLPANDAALIPVSMPSLKVGTLDDYFPGGPGAIHIYGLNVPYTLYPASNS